MAFLAPKVVANVDCNPLADSVVVFRFTPEQTLFINQQLAHTNNLVGLQDAVVAGSFCQ